MGKTISGIIAEIVCTACPLMDSVQTLRKITDWLNDGGIIYEN